MPKQPFISIPLDIADVRVLQKQADDGAGRNPSPV